MFAPQNTNTNKKQEGIPLANLVFAGSLVVFILLFPSVFSGIDTWFHDTWLWLRTNINRPTSKLSYLKQFAPQKPASDEITIVLVDDRSILELPGLYNGDRSYYAEVIKRLSEHKPKLIAIDSFFGTTSAINRRGDVELCEAVKKNPRVVLKAYRRDAKHITPPFPQLALSGTYAPSYLSSYRGEACRRVSMVYINEVSQLKPSFLAEMWRAYNGLSENDIKFNSEYMLVRNSNNKINKIPITNNEYMMLNYDIPIKQFRTISFYDILRGKYPAKAIENKAIIIGEAHSMLHESYYTPQGIHVFSPYINALALRNLINDNYLTQPNLLLSQIIPITLLGIFIFFVFNILSPFASLIISILTCPVLLLASFLCLTLKSYIFDISASLLAVIGSLIFVTGRKYYLEVSEKLKIKNAFQHYVTASVVNEILKDPEKLQLHGEIRELTIFFSDIEGFTSMSEGMSPLDVVSLLNEYLTEMTDIIFKYDGLLDKYEGDAIMSIFGAPIDQRDHAIRSCLCALENQKALARLRQHWKNESKPMLKARIGINTGDVVVGNMGSKMRFDYTVIGDNVNLASRLEAANKLFGSEILVSESTASLASERIISRHIACLKVIGKANAVNVYEVLGDRLDDDKTAIHIALLAKEKYESALKMLSERNFKEASDILEEYLKDNSEDKPAQFLYSKIQGYLVIPPPEGMEITVSQEVK